MVEQFTSLTQDFLATLPAVGVSVICYVAVLVFSVRYRCLHHALIGTCAVISLGMIYWGVFELGLAPATAGQKQFVQSMSDYSENIEEFVLLTNDDLFVSVSDYEWVRDAVLSDTD